MYAYIYPHPSQPSEPIKLQRDFSLVTLCLVMTASLVGSSVFSNPLWLVGNEVCPGVQVVSSPISQTYISSQSVIPEPQLAWHRNYPNVDQISCYQNWKNPQSQMECWFLKINQPCLIEILQIFQPSFILQWWSDQPRTKQFYLPMLMWDHSASNTCG